jgi:hypothetical protein
MVTLQHEKEEHNAETVQRQGRTAILWNVDRPDQCQH